MRILKLTVGATLVGSLLAASAMAQSASGPVLSQPNSVRKTAFEYDDYLSFAPTDKPSASPSDSAAPPAPVKAPAVKTPAPAVAAEAAKADEKKDDAGDEKKDEPKRLIGDTGFAGINIYGYFDLGQTLNTNNPGSHYNGLLAPNDRDDFQFNQVYLTFERTIDTEKNCWDIGGRVDLLYGSDYIFCQSVGLETNPDGTSKWNSGLQNGLAMPQIYGEIGHGQLSAKLGHFYTIIGYEVLQPTGNFFYSHNYAVRYAEPTAHTGGLFTWKNSDELSVYAGGVNGGDRFDGVEDTFAVLTGFAYTPKEKKWNVNFGIMTGGTEPGTVTAPIGPRTYMSTVLTYNINDNWQSVSQWDAGWQGNYDGQNNTADFYSYTQYLFYTINPCWKAGVRYDVFVDDQGTRLTGLRNGMYSDGSLMPGGNPQGAIAGTAQAISLGLNYTPNNNIRIRPELRWDWFSGPTAAATPVYQVGSTGGSNGQCTAACDLIVQF